MCGKAQKVIILMAHIWKRESARGRRVAFIPVVVQIGRNPTHAKFIPGRAKVLLLLVFGYCSSVCERETSSHPRFLCPRSLLLYMLVYIYIQAGRRPERKFFASFIVIVLREKRCIGNSSVCASRFWHTNAAEREARCILQHTKAINFNFST